MRQPHDFYPTPMSVVDRLLDNLKWAGTAWEPCAGDGRLVRAMQARGFVVMDSDIASGDDFFSVTSAPAVTLVTNPPFRVVRQFIDHAFAIGVERMALICGERLWACGKGLAQFERHRPSRFANMSWREDYLGKGGSPDRALAVSIWDTPHAETCGYEVWGRDAQ